MPHFMCGSGARWCARADAIFDVPGMHVLDVEVDDRQRLVLTVESGQLERGLPFVRGARGRPRPPGPDAARRAVLRPGHPGALAGADLALPRAGVPDRTFSEAHEWRRRGWR